MRSLNRFVDYSVDYTEGVKFQLDSVDGTVGNFLVLLVEVVEELCCSLDSFVIRDKVICITYGRAIMSIIKVLAPYRELTTGCYASLPSITLSP